MGRKSKIVIGLVVFLIAWVIIGVAYNLVYYEAGDDGYNCDEMSESQLKRFQWLGISGRTVCGINIEDVTIVYDNESMELSGYHGDGHVWLEINILGLKIPWESTFLLPLNPAWFGSYDIIYYDADFEEKMMEKYGGRNEEI